MSVRAADEANLYSPNNYFLFIIFLVSRITLRSGEEKQPLKSHLGNVYLSNKFVG